MDDLQHPSCTKHAAVRCLLVGRCAKRVCCVSDAVALVGPSTTRHISRALCSCTQQNDVNQSSLVAGYIVFSMKAGPSDKKRGTILRLV